MLHRNQNQRVQKEDRISFQIVEDKYKGCSKAPLIQSPADSLEHSNSTNWPTYSQISCEL